MWFNIMLMIQILNLMKMICSILFIYWAFIKRFLSEKSLGHLSKSKTLLITQNQLLENENLSCIKYFFSLPGKFDGISFNYQIMAILDLIRIIYYQEYFVEYTEEALESR